MYGEEKTDGTRASLICHQNNGFTIMYYFERTDIATMDDGYAERLYAMIRSARCFDNTSSTAGGEE